MNYTNNQDPAGYVNSLSTWDAIRKDDIEKSNRRAWTVAGCFGASTVALTIAIAVMLPLKQTLPFLIVDNEMTGVPEIVSVMKDQVLTYNEARNKSYMAKYVQLHEAYDYYNTAEIYNTVGMFSSEVIGQEYAKDFKGENSKYEVMGDDFMTKVRVTNVVPTANGLGGSVRFVKTTINTKNGKTVDEENLIATMAYEYQNTLRMDEDVRLVNPFGFRVLSYRVDPDGFGGAK